MGAGRSALRRTVRGPVETRKKLEKVLETDPKVAPKHESTKDILDTARTENQALFEAHNKKNTDYLDLLQRIHVTSVDVNKIEKKENISSKSSSTIDRTGRLSSEQLVFLFQQRMANPKEWNEEKIAAHFKLPPRTVESLLKYYSDFNVEKAPQIPEPLAEITA